jgi:hypothetical protein
VPERERPADEIDGGTNRSACNKEHSSPHPNPSCLSRYDERTGKRGKKACHEKRGGAGQVSWVAICGVDETELLNGGQRASPPFMTKPYI